MKGEMVAVWCYMCNEACKSVIVQTVEPTPKPPWERGEGV